VARDLNQQKHAFSVLATISCTTNICTLVLVKCSKKQNTATQNVKSVSNNQLAYVDITS